MNNRDFLRDLEQARWMSTSKEPHAGNNAEPYVVVARELPTRSDDPSMRMLRPLQKPVLCFLAQPRTRSALSVETILTRTQCSHLGHRYFKASPTRRCVARRLLSRLKKLRWCPNNFNLWKFQMSSTSLPQARLVLSSEIGGSSQYCPSSVWSSKILGTGFLCKGDLERIEPNLTLEW